ncbi:MAG: hypothetical protein AAFO15_01650 [Pseudomonadota bacterium]
MEPKIETDQPLLDMNEKTNNDDPTAIIQTADIMTDLLKEKFKDNSNYIKELEKEAIDLYEELQNKDKQIQFLQLENTKLKKQINPENNTAINDLLEKIKLLELENTKLKEQIKHKNRSNTPKIKYPKSSNNFQKKLQRRFTPKKTQKKPNDDLNKGSIFN